MAWGGQDLSQPQQLFIISRIGAPEVLSESCLSALP